MTDPIIPAAVKRAAKRAFVRTLTQGYYNIIAGFSLSTLAVGVLALIGGEVALLPAILNAAAFLFTPFVGATAAYLNITHNGIPEDYATATLARHSIYTPTEILTDVNHAAEVVEGRA